MDFTVQLPIANAVVLTVQPVERKAARDLGAMREAERIEFALFEGGLVAPNARQVLYLAVAGVFLSLGYLFMVQTLRYADISTSATIRFSVVLWALLSGITVFGDWPDRFALLGILLIVGSGIYTLRREAKLRSLRNAQGKE